MSFTHLIPACLYFRLNLFCSKLRISIRIYIIGGIECVYIYLKYQATINNTIAMLGNFPPLQIYYSK